MDEPVQVMGDSSGAEESASDSVRRSRRRRKSKRESPSEQSRPGGPGHTPTVHPLIRVRTSDNRFVKPPKVLVFSSHLPAPKFSKDSFFLVNNQFGQTVASDHFIDVAEKPACVLLSFTPVAFIQMPEMLIKILVFRL
jgi:hypothetical protein